MGRPTGQLTAVASITADEADQSEEPATVVVWDPFVRVSHWGLVTAILVALATSLVLPPTWITAHIVSGTVAATLVVARIVWGLLGPTTARFSSFVRGPREFLRHLEELWHGEADRHLGHNPAGGAMIVALLATVSVIALTGFVTLGGSFKSGPLSFATSFATGEFARHLHELLAYGLIGLIFLHIGGAVFESRRTRENLVHAMVHGRKADRHGDVAPRPQRARPVLAAIIVATVLVASTAVLFTLAKLPALGAPVAALDPVYAKECGACHMPYHPSLAPRATWSAMMDGLDNHFGEDASLDPPAAQAIRAYLLANAGEAYDTRPANVFRRRNAADPLRMTATPFWQRMHGRIADAVFTGKAVGGQGACAACHQDAATGLFNPSAIAFPKESLQ
jgi:cytochrome b